MQGDYSNKEDFMLISDLLNHTQRSAFVGRSSELNALMELLNSDLHAWKMLNLHGPGGIGKTTLLRMFAEEVGNSRCIYIPSHMGQPTPEHFVYLISRELESNELHHKFDKSYNLLMKQKQLSTLLAQKAEEVGGLIILVDAFDHWADLDNWFREEWLPSLSSKVKWCLTSREPLGGAWKKSGWNQLMNQLELLPLTTSEVRQFIKRIGITELSIARKMHHVSGGIPLSLSIACDIVDKHGIDDIEQRLSKQAMFGDIFEEWVQGQAEHEFIELLEAACVLWRFDQELLEAVLQRSISVMQFRDFCNKSFVTRYRNDWRLQDLIRQLVMDDLNRRKPAQYTEYRMRALEEIQKRERFADDGMSEWIVDKINLLEHDFIRNLSYQHDNEIMLNTCTLSDLDQVEALYSSYMEKHIKFYPNDPHLLKHIRPLWNAAPSSYYGIWMKKRMVAFCVVVPLNEATVAVLQQSPITAPLTSCYVKGQSQYAIPFAGMDMDLEYEISGALAKSLSMLLNLDAQIVNLLSEPMWVDLLRLIGYERAEWADGWSEDGVHYKGFHIDLRGELLSNRIDRLLSIRELSREQMRQEADAEPTISLDDTVRLVKQLLKNFGRLPYESNRYKELYSFLNGSGSGRSDEQMALHLQQWVVQEVEGLEVGKQSTELYGKLLRYAYIQKIGTHEIVAERLNLTVPTYYRYLHSATRKLALLLRHSSSLINEDTARE